MPNRIDIASLRLAASAARRWKAISAPASFWRTFPCVATLTTARDATWHVLRLWRSAGVARRRLVRGILADPALQFDVLGAQRRVLRLDARVLRFQCLDARKQHLHPALQARDAVDVGGAHAFVRSRGDLAVDPRHAARRSGLHPVNGYDRTVSRCVALREPDESPERTRCTERHTKRLVDQGDTAGRVWIVLEPDIGLVVGTG